MTTFLPFTEPAMPPPLPGAAAPGTVNLHHAPLELARRPAQPITLRKHEPTPEPAVSACGGVPEVLSPTSINTFIHDCQAKWFYRKVLRLPETRSAALGLGSAVHAALGENFRQKIETRVDMPTPAVTAFFDGALTQELDRVMLTADDDVEDLRNAGRTMIELYMRAAAPAIQPAAVELPVEGKIGDVRVHGIIDLLDVEGNVIDVKTAAKKPSGTQPAYRNQISTYAMLAKTSGRARLDTLTKTKTVALHHHSLELTPQDRQYTERLYSIAADQMAAGVYVPNRASHLCNRKYCSFADRCEAEYGGTVE